MNIQIINTGNELLIGTTLNTHGAWLGQELLKIGLRVQRQVTVPDGDAIRNELTSGLANNDILIITGGLGPTSDDITREETAAALGIDLIEDEFALRNIEDFFKSRGKVMAECNKKQALNPCGADVLPNHKGTAPGVYIPPRLGNSSCAVFLLPGPPFELKPMFLEEVVPRLNSLKSDDSTVSKMQVLSFIGVGESNFHAEIDQQLQQIKGLEFGYCARPSDIDLRLIGSDAMITEAKKIALAQFSQYCYTQNGESIEQVLVQQLTEQKLQITTAESCTGGFIASRITDVPGSSAIFSEGFVTYSNQSKSRLLDVAPALIATHGAVSEEVAIAMADGALKNASADIAISVTGIAGPSGGTEEKPVGTVWIGIAQKGKTTFAYKEWHPRGREIFKQIVSQRILAKLHQIIK